MEWQTQALQLRCWHRVSSLLGLIVVSWQATGGGVSSYFQTLFIRLKASSSASEVRVQLTVGLAPQYRVLTDISHMQLPLRVSNCDAYMHRALSLNRLRD